MTWIKVNGRVLNKSRCTDQIRNAHGAGVIYVGLP